MAMQRWLALLVLIAAAAYAAASLSPAGSPVAATEIAYAGHCHAGYVHADVPWRTKPKCLRAGQICRQKGNTTYHKYGFQCVNGKLRKQRGKGVGR